MINNPLSKPNRFHHEMMNFLRDASKEHPLDLNTAYHLHDSSTRETYYGAYMDLVRLKYIESDKSGFWLTELGNQYLLLVKNTAREKLKI